MPTSPASISPPRDPSHTWQRATQLKYFRYLHSQDGKAEFRLGFPWVSVVIAGVLFLSIVAIPAGIGHVIGIIIRQSMRRKRFDSAVTLSKRCVPLFVYPVRVNSRLREFRNQVASGLVMGSFEELKGDYYAKLASVLQEISQARPDALTGARLALRQTLTDERYVEGRRRRLPDELTGGAPVFLFDLMIDGSKLVGGRLIGDRIICMADQGDSGVIFNIPYHTIDMPVDPLAPSETDELPDDPCISDECFALIDSAPAPIGPGHPIHAVVDDVREPCPRCGIALVTLLSLRLDAPELREFASKRLSPGLQVLRVIVCEHCCAECLHTFAAWGPTGELIPDSVRVHDEYGDESFPPSPPSPPAPDRSPRRWRRDALRLDPIPHPRDAAINYALGSTSSHLGGLPRWIQDPEAPTCSGCQDTMPFLAHVDEVALGDGGTDLFAFWCPACMTTAVIPQQS